MLITALCGCLLEALPKSRKSLENRLKRGFCKSLLGILSLASTHSGVKARDEPAPKPLMTISVKGERIASDGHWMAFTPSGGSLAIRYADRGSEDAKLGVFNAATGESVASTVIKGGGGIAGHAACAIAPNSDWIAYGEGKNLRFLAIPPNRGVLPGGGMISVFSRNVVRSFPSSLKKEMSVWLDRKGETAFVHRTGSGKTVGPALREWDLAKMRGRDLVQAPIEDCVIYAVALSPAAQQMAVSTKPVLFGEKSIPIIEFWSIRGNPTKRTIKTKFSASSVAYSPDGKILAAGFENGTLAWYDSASGKAIKGIATPDDHTVGALAFHPGGAHLACGLYAQGTWNLFLIDIASGEIVNKLVADVNGTMAVCFSPTGDRLAAFGSSGKVTIWDATKLLGPAP